MKFKLPPVARLNRKKKEEANYSFKKAIKKATNSFINRGTENFVTIEYSIGKKKI